MLFRSLNAYFLDTGRYPTSEQGLEALWDRPVLEPVPEGWQGPYLTKELPEDPWGNHYDYFVPGPSGLPYGIRSYGADGSEGGDEAAADIVSWKN